jgi:16S rRNA G966 N2-methylase RsmD
MRRLLIKNERHTPPPKLAPMHDLEVKQHLNRQIPPLAHTAMYVWHKYWSRKTWNVVSEFIKTYTREGEIVFDPFAGSGVVAMEAVRNGRKAIVCDLNPIASEITELTLRPVDVGTIIRAFRRIEEQVKSKIDQLYVIHCVKCEKELVCNSFVREDDTLMEVRYPKCPHCGYRAETAKPAKQDLLFLRDLEKRPINEWYPSVKFQYRDGSPFVECQRYESLDELFTKRNLQALAWLHAAIEEDSSRIGKRFLMGAFTSMVHLCSRMMPVGRPQPTNHYTYFSSPGWTQHSYWSARRYMEQSVWEKFESAVLGHQGIVNAKKESERLIPRVKITNDWKKVIEGTADVAIVTGDCLELMEEMPSGCVDYIFTDPPYGKSVQYGELSLIWNAWLQRDPGYVDRLVASEIVHNDRQHKNFDVYHSLLSNSFKKCFGALRPGRYMTLTFHNPTFKVRNATVRAGVFAGFEYQKIHHQPLGQVSAKSMLQPFGSAQGDFYLRFHRAKANAPIQLQLEEITADRFRRVVIETCKQVIAERAEPTPYTILLNYVDPVLAKRGFFSTLDTGLDVKTVLEEAEGKDFKLVATKIGGASGKQWWFNDPIFARRLRETPLTERVEKTVLNSLRDKGRVTFTEVWDAVSREFPNSLTSDSTSIKEALEIYARRVGNGFWLLKEEVRERIRIHPEIIALLAMIGHNKGFDVWIGRNEQGNIAEGLAGNVRLSTLVTKRPTSLAKVDNLRDVLLMDLLWIKGETVVCAFEVESTTTMTSGLQRGSNLPCETPKVMVLPEERYPDYQRKMQSPLFKENFTQNAWKLLYFDTLRSVFSRHRERTQLENLFDRRAAREKKPMGVVRARQQRLRFQ